MNSNRIEEIQKSTAYPKSQSVMLALKQVWNECEHSHTKAIEAKDEEIESLKAEVRRFKEIAGLCSDMVALSPAPKKGYGPIEELAELQNKINELTR